MKVLLWILAGLALAALLFLAWIRATVAAFMYRYFGA